MALRKLYEGVWIDRSAADDSVVDTLKAERPKNTALYVRTLNERCLQASHVPTSYRINTDNYGTIPI